MLFQEPQAEFVPITLNDITTLSPGIASYETCNGKPAASNNCLSDGVFWLNNEPDTQCTGTYDPQEQDWDYT